MLFCSLWQWLSGCCQGGTANAVETWNGDLTASTQTISGGVTITADITLTIPTGVTLTVNGGINAGSNTLTVSGDGTLIVRGTTGTTGDNGNPGGNGFTGNMIVNCATVDVTGDSGGYGSNSDNEHRGGNGGNGIHGKITVNSGSVKVTGGNGGACSGGTGGDGGNGISGNITVSSGSVEATGGSGGSATYYSGSSGRAVAGTIDASKAQGSDNNSTWTDITGTSSTKRYVKIEVIAVTGVSLDKTAVTLLSGDTVTLTATVSPDNATSKAVTWTTSDENIASVDQSGDVTAMGVGTATITATATNGTTAASDDKTATCTVTVVKNPTITFDANGGSGSMNAQTISYDVATTLTANAFTRTSYTFNGWNTSADATGTSYADKASIKVSADKTLYAQWTAIIYVISYDLDGGTNNTANPTSYTVTSPDITLQAPTKTGYTFAKWTSGDTEIASIPQGSTGDMTLKANWTANTYTVKFNSNGGTGSMSDLTLTYDVEQALSNNTFTRTGYTFNNWKDNDGNKSYNGGASVKNLTAVNGATITLYAQWKVNQYTLTFNTDGGSAISAITQDYGTAVTAPANPTKEGYTFNGWDKEIPSTMPAENLTFTAQWKENEKTPDPDPVPESDDQKGSTDPKTDDPAQEAEESADKTPDTDSKDISSEDKTPESKTANAEAVSTMSNEELKQTFENKTAITLTGNISNENLSSVIEKIASVTEVKTLDLSKL